MQQKSRRRNCGWFKEIETVIKLSLFYRSHQKKKKGSENIKKMKGCNSEHINKRTICYKIELVNISKSLIS